MGASERGHQVVIVKRMNGKPLPLMSEPPSDGAEEEERRESQLIGQSGKPRQLTAKSRQHSSSSNVASFFLSLSVLSITHVGRQESGGGGEI